MLLLLELEYLGMKVGVFTNARTTWCYKWLEKEFFNSISMRFSSRIYIKFSRFRNII
jgi:hypothetical protein